VILLSQLTPGLTCLIRSSQWTINGLLPLNHKRAACRHHIIRRQYAKFMKFWAWGQIVRINSMANRPKAEKACVPQTVSKV
jgi:hypothetical protein